MDRQRTELGEMLPLVGYFGIGAPLDQVFQFGQARSCLVAAQADRLDQASQRRSHARSKRGLFREHGGDRFHSAPLVDEQHKELLAHDAFEFAKGHATASLLAQTAQQVEPALVENAIGLVEVQQRADRRFARATLGNGSLQLIDPLSDQRKMHGVLTGNARACIRRLEPYERL